MPTGAATPVLETIGIALDEGILSLGRGPQNPWRRPAAPDERAERPKGSIIEALVRGSHGRCALVEAQLQPASRTFTVSAGRDRVRRADGGRRRPPIATGDGYSPRRRFAAVADGKQRLVALREESMAADRA